MPAKERRTKHEKILNGQAKIIIGTHAVFQEDVSYENLSLGNATLDAKERCYYFRVFLSDQKGAMAELTSLLSKNNISIDKIIQKGDTHLEDEKSSTPVVMMTYPVNISAIESAVAEISGTDLISMEPIFLPILKEV